MLDGYEDGRDESDEGGSKAIPSRTHAGKIAAFVKEFPCYGDSRWIPFVGRIVNYTARCVLTIQQLQLMQCDLPHTLYLKQKGGGKKGAPANWSYNPNDPAIEKQLAAIRRSKERQEARGEHPEYTMEEIFKR